MCIAIYNKRGVLKHDELKNSWDSNKDGAGFAYFNRQGKLIIRKELYNFKVFKKMYISHRVANPNVPFLVHFRITTHGGNTYKNTHPHKVSDELVFIHNGILRDYTPTPTYGKHWQRDKTGAWIQYSAKGDKDEPSDTVNFKDEVLKFVDPYNLTTTTGFLLKKLIGNHNKLVLLNKKNEVLIVNASQGVWEGSNWFSNTSHQSKAACTPKKIKEVARVGFA